MPDWGLASAMTKFPHGMLRILKNLKKYFILIQCFQMLLPIKKSYCVILCVNLKTIHVWFYWIYNLIRAIFFSKYERLFKKNMYNSIIQSIAHLKL